MPPTGLPLSGGTLATLSSSAPLTDVIVALNEIINTLNQQLETSVQSDGVSKRFLQGYQLNGWPGGNFGIKISFPGVDVTTAGTNQLLFSWDFTTNTQYWYDQNTGKNYMQVGTLPDGTGGWDVADVGNNVADGY